MGALRRNKLSLSLSFSHSRRRIAAIAILALCISTCGLSLVISAVRAWTARPDLLVNTDWMSVKNLQLNNETAPTHLQFEHDFSIGNFEQLGSRQLGNATRFLSRAKAGVTFNVFTALHAEDALRVRQVETTVIMMAADLYDSVFWATGKRSATSYAYFKEYRPLDEEGCPAGNPLFGGSLLCEYLRMLNPQQAKVTDWQLNENEIQGKLSFEVHLTPPLYTGTVPIADENGNFLENINVRNPTVYAGNVRVVSIKTGTVDSYSDLFVGGSDKKEAGVDFLDGREDAPSSATFAHAIDHIKASFETLGVYGTNNVPRKTQLQQGWCRVQQGVVGSSQAGHATPSLSVDIQPEVLLYMQELELSQNLNMIVDVHDGLVIKDAGIYKESPRRIDYDRCVGYRVNNLYAQIEIEFNAVFEADAYATGETGRAILAAPTIDATDRIWDLAVQGQAAGITVRGTKGDLLGYIMSFGGELVNWFASMGLPFLLLGVFALVCYFGYKKIRRM